MFYFIIGTPSCGKSNLINYIKNLHPEFIYLSANEEAMKISYEIVELLKIDKFTLINKRKFFSIYDNKLSNIWLSLFKKYSKNKVVIINDNYPSVIKYINKLNYKKKLILLGLEFNKLYNNIISTKNINLKIPAFILEDVIDIYRLSNNKISKNCDLIFKKKDLNKFNNLCDIKPKLYLSHKIKSALKKVYKYYGLDKHKQVCVEPKIEYDLFINNKDVKKSADIILKFID